MEKTIYLPSDARKQFETSDDSSVWARPISYQTKPSGIYNIKLTFDPESDEFEGIDPTEAEYFYPSRANPDMILELLVDVNLKEITEGVRKKAIEDKIASVG